MATQFTDNPFLMRQELGDQGINPYGDPLRSYMSFLGQGSRPAQEVMESYLMTPQARQEQAAQGFTQPSVPQYQMPETPTMRPQTAGALIRATEPAAAAATPATTTTAATQQVSSSAAPSPRTATQTAGALSEMQNYYGTQGGASMGNPQYAEIQKTLNAIRAPKVDDATWQQNVASHTGQGREVGAIYRDPNSGYGVSVILDQYNRPAGFSFKDQSGRQVQPSTFNAANLYKYAEEFGIDLKGIGDLGRQLEAKGIGYKPYELAKNTGSDVGINFDDIARGGLGTAFDWTKPDKGLAEKYSQYGPDSLAYQMAAQKEKERIEMAARLGLQKSPEVTFGGGIDPSKFGPIAGRGEEPRQFVVYSGGTASWYPTAAEAQAAAKNYPGSVIYDLSQGVPPSTKPGVLPGP